MRAVGLLRNLANFPGPFPWDSGGSPGSGTGTGTWTGTPQICATGPPGIRALCAPCAVSHKLSVLSFP